MDEFDSYGKVRPRPAKVRYLRTEGFKVECTDLALRPRKMWGLPAHRLYLHGTLHLEGQAIEFELPVMQRATAVDITQDQFRFVYPYHDPQTGEEGFELMRWTMTELTEWLLQCIENEQQRQKERKEYMSFRPSGRW